MNVNNNNIILIVIKLLRYSGKQHAKTSMKKADAAALILLNKLEKNP